MLPLQWFKQDWALPANPLSRNVNFSNLGLNYILKDQFIAHLNLNIFFFSFGVGQAKIFQNWLIFQDDHFEYWQPYVIFKIEHFCPIAPFEVVRIETFLHKLGVIVFMMIILSTTNPMLSSKLNVLSHNSIQSGQIWKIPSQAEVVFFKTIIMCTNNPMLASKLNVWSITPFQAFRFEKFVHKQGLLFEMMVLNTTNPMLSSKLNVLSITLFQVLRFEISFTNWGCFFFQDSHFEFQQLYVILKIECFVPYLHSK